MLPDFALRRFSLVALCLAGCVTFTGAGCAKVHSAMPDDASFGDGGRGGDLAGADLLQNENPTPSPCGDCGDKVPCTTDVCLPTKTCSHIPDHGKCGDRQLCTSAGCVDIANSKLCTRCSVDAECGLDESCAMVPNGDMGVVGLCLARCGAGGTCPKGFSCDPSQSRCVPDSDSGLCCYDGDADKRGIGAGCLGADCDDSDANVFSGHPEICDGKDNDCNGSTDEGYLCGGPKCGLLGTSGAYGGSAIPQCLTGQCAPATVNSCGGYTCQTMTTPVAGSNCGTSCTGTNDTACIATSYCDGSACSPRLPNGSVCSRDQMCGSNHCQNGHCCGSGDCCATSTDCPSVTYATPPVCDAPPTSCQGHRRDPFCDAAGTCGSVQVDDDRACGSSIGIDCTPLLAQSCTGAATQNALACPTTCSTDANCVASAYCNGTTCVARKPDGSTCATDNQCGTGHHCLNGFCCDATTGACCGVATDCPAQYAGAATCDAPVTSCQGHRTDKICVASICGSLAVADDSACTSSIGKPCGAYAPTTCTGATTQSALTCPATCTSDSQCVQPQNHCLGGQCMPWVSSGGTCTASSQCLSGFCVGTTCCQSSCNATSCDSCGGGACQPFLDPQEAGNMCTSSLPDLGSGAFTSVTVGYLQSTSDDEDWYQFYATDAGNSCTGFLRVRLAVPAGVDYDVYLYSTPTGSCSGTTLLVAGLSSSGDEDQRWNEQCTLSDEGWYLVRVKRYAGSSCSEPYTLTVDARL